MTTGTPKRDFALVAKELEDLLGRDEQGFFHMHLTDGSTMMFAPATPDCSFGRGEAYLAVEGERQPQVVPLEEAIKVRGTRWFLMTEDDFADFAEQLLSGRIGYDTVQ